MKPKFKLTRGGIQYFDQGGAVSDATRFFDPGSNGEIDPSKQKGTVLNPGGYIFNGDTLNGIAKLPKTIGGMLTTNNDYQAQLAPTMQTDYSPYLGTAGETFNANLGNQNNLARQLIMQSQGQGPNPAMAQLNNTTGNNVATQAALMAGQRGSSVNPGLMARQIAMNGAGVQQNAVGQGAALQAQQQLAAQGQLSNLYGQIGNQTGAMFTGAAGAQNAQNTGNIQNYGMAQGINSNVAQQNTAQANKMTGGVMSAIGGGASSAASMFAKGGKVMPSHLSAMAKIYHPHLADGGEVYLAPTGWEKEPEDYNEPSGEAKKGGGMSSLLPMLMMLANGGCVPALESTGGAVPGTAKVKGDSYKNDTVDAKLSPGEAVIPRSVMQSDDPVGGAAKFVANLIKDDANGNEEEDFKMALKKAISQRKSK